MCGRYATSRSAADLSALFDAADETAGGDGIDVLKPDYNIAPTDPVPVVRVSRRRGGRVVCVARWGLVPAWAKDTSGAARMINARAETVATTKAYAPSFAGRRCLVPADGWYEWQRRTPRERQPYFMTRADGGVSVFAGLWAARGDLLTCSIVTTAAVGEFALVHDRMPLVLPPERWAAWLDCGATAVDPAGLLAPPPVAFLDALEIRPVSAAVGDVRNDGPHLVERVPAAPLSEPHNLTLF